MSLINDALKQARKTPPPNTPSALPPLVPHSEGPRLLAWLMPAVVIVLIMAAIFFIGWTVAHHSVRPIVLAPEITDAPSLPPAPSSQPAVTPPPVESPPPLNPPDAPKLQGISYSPTAPAAIVNGKTVHIGDQYREYKVKAISKFTVTLVGPDKKEILIGMGN
jgi:hypothetical protein